MAWLARLRDALFLKIFLRLCAHIRHGCLTLTLPDGSQHRFGSGGAGATAHLAITDQRAIRMIMLGGALGFCEAYMLGYVTSDNAAAVIEVAARQGKSFTGEKLRTNKIRNWMLSLFHWRARNNRHQAKDNIASHYDLGNRFYQLWLDSSLTYSSAYFTPASAKTSRGRRDNRRSLEWGQQNKYARIADLAGIGKGSRVLEIGCGWGGFAEYVAKHRNAHVTAITISKQQHRFTKQRIKQAGLTAQVDVQFIDYRDCASRFGRQFDSIVSIEMIEAVGAEYWGVYFRTIADCLKASGRAVLQMITIDEALYDDYRHQPDFIQRYIFPGGMLPTMAVLAQPIREARLTIDSDACFGQDYAETLAEWRRRFQRGWGAIAKLGFDAKFKRMWDLYLAYCEGGFRAQSIDVRHVTLRHQGD